MARQPRTTSAPAAPVATNPLATAYFRALDDEEDTAPDGTSAGAPERAPHRDATERSAGADDDLATSIDAVVELLTEAARLRQDSGGQGVTPERPRALLEAPGEDPRAAKLPLLRRLMEFLLHHDETAHLTRSRELAFLANTLVAGCSVQS